MAHLVSTKSRRIYLFASALLVIVLVYQITRGGSLLHSDSQLDEVLDGPLPQMLEPAGSQALVTANSELAKARQALQQSVAETAPVTEPAKHDVAPPVSNAWRIADASAPSPSMPLPGGVVTYEPVAVDMENPVYPEAGQQTAVTLPGGEQLRVNVKSNTDNPNGDYSWRGHLDGYGDEYPVVMTYGGNSVFATVTTPNGSYSLESVNGSGWIYKNPSEFELSHPGANDFLEIPHNH